jgi:hypothetical protein
MKTHVFGLHKAFIATSVSILLVACTALTVGATSAKTVQASPVLRPTTTVIPGAAPYVLPGTTGVSVTTVIHKPAVKPVVKNTINSLPQQAVDGSTPPVIPRATATTAAAKISFNPINVSYEQYKNTSCAYTFDVLATSNMPLYATFHFKLQLVNNVQNVAVDPTTTTLEDSPNPADYSYQKADTAQLVTNSYELVTGAQYSIAFAYSTNTNPDKLIYGDTAYFTVSGDCEMIQ